MSKKFLTLSILIGNLCRGLKIVFTYSCFMKINLICCRKHKCFIFLSSHALISLHPIHDSACSYFFPASDTWFPTILNFFLRKCYLCPDKMSQPTYVSTLQVQIIVLPCLGNTLCPNKSFGPCKMLLTIVQISPY